jgi:MoaA/NifB/PqqE/SkfB family radical SAM enzyme
MSISVENNHKLVEEYAARASFVHSFPVVMYIHSTRGCPYSCIMCNVPERWGRKSRDIDPVILEQVKPYFKYLEVLGMHGPGEPLLSKNLDFFIQAAQELTVRSFL